MAPANKRKRSDDSFQKSKKHKTDTPQKTKPWWKKRAEKKKLNREKSQIPEGMELVEDPLAATKTYTNAIEQNQNRKRKFSTKHHARDAKRTAFVGNVPFRPMKEDLKQLEKKIRKFFKEKIEEFHEKLKQEGKEERLPTDCIESIRFRNVPVQSEEEIGHSMYLDARIKAKKYRVSELEHPDDFYEISAYVKLRNNDDVFHFSYLFDQTEFGGSILHVDEASIQGNDTDEKVNSRTAVLAGVPFKMKTKELWDMFPPEIQKQVKYIRILRNGMTRQGMGIAFVVFRKDKFVAQFLRDYTEIVMPYKDEEVRVTIQPHFSDEDQRKQFARAENKRVAINHSSNQQVYNKVQNRTRKNRLEKSRSSRRNASNVADGPTTERLSHMMNKVHK